MSQLYLGNELISSLDSNDITYDNSTSGLSSKTVQKALDEISASASTKAEVVEITEEAYLALEAAGEVDPDVVYIVDDETTT